MTGEWTNHLWQSTWFAVAAALLTLAFRRNRAQVRYWLWLAASVKFLVPFSLLMSLGDRLWDMLPAGKVATEIATPAVSLAMAQVAQPFSDSFSFAGPLTPSAQHATNWIPIAILGVWACGFAVVVFMRLRGWLRIQAAVRASTPVNTLSALPGDGLSTIPSDISVAVEVRSSPGLLEPGVVGFLHPVLLLPEGILKSLTAPQMEAVLAHELCHVRRRDNLTSAIHMVVEAIFWFYPPIWWIGARLVEERERACDEAVLSLVSEPREYADAILNVCKAYVESPLACVSGISGSDLKKRVIRIMTHHMGRKLDFSRKLLLVAAGVMAVAAPVVFGLVNANAPQNGAESQTQNVPKFGPEFKYDVASIKPNKSGPPVGRNGVIAWFEPPDGFRIKNVSSLDLFRVAYGSPGIAMKKKYIFGAPDWFDSDRYDVVAKIDSSVGDELQKLDRSQRQLARQQMLQELLVDRFKLKIHYETREVPVYVIVIAKNGPKFKEAKPGETFPYEDEIKASFKRQRMNSDFSKGWSSIERPNGGVATAGFWGVTMTRVAGFFGRYLDLAVVDKTGLTGRYDLTLQWMPSDGQQQVPPRPPAPNGQPVFVPPDPTGIPPLSFKAVEKQLGLKLKPGTASFKVAVIDHIEKPSEN